MQDYILELIKKGYEFHYFFDDFRNAVGIGILKKGWYTKINIPFEHYTELLLKEKIEKAIDEIEKGIQKHEGNTGGVDND